VTHFKGFGQWRRHTGREGQPPERTEDPFMDPTTADSLAQRIRSDRRAGATLAQRVALAVLVAAASLWLAAPAAASAVYKWVDPQGHIHYSDRPPPPEGKLLSIEDAPHSQPMTAHAANSPGPASSAPPPPAAARPQTPAAQAQLKATVAEDVATTREQQCKDAKSRYDNYVRSRRLFKEGPDKERIYLSDAEIETARVNAKRELDEFCADAQAAER
jgi:hypothetical protein